MSWVRYSSRCCFFLFHRMDPIRWWFFFAFSILRLSGFHTISLPIPNKKGTKPICAGIWYLTFTSTRIIADYVYLTTLFNV
ncbi:hypothetical protein V1522DRAFT_458219 [Lipomyces starkeyi]